ncbi:MAG: sigma-70 family RNA polymerase sigma factor [Candidatus Cloacimonadia bacterium]
MTENPAEDKTLQKYLSEIADIPTLSRAEERELIKRAQAGDQEAMNKLIESNLKFVVKVASKFQGQGLSLSELISEGNLGLIKAIKRFDLSRNTKLITYAVWWIQQAIQSAILEKNKLIRIPAKTVSTIGKLEEARRKHRTEKGNELPVKEIAKKMDIKEKKARELLQQTPEVISLDEIYGETDALSRMQIQKVGETGTASEELDTHKIYRRKRLKEKINKKFAELSPRDAHIIKEYFGFGENDKGKNFAQIARELGLSRERVRQIFKQIIEDLRKEVVNEDDIDQLLRM